MQNITWLKYNMRIWSMYWVYLWSLKEISAVVAEI